MKGVWYDRHVIRRGGFWLACACAPALAACSLLLGEGFTDPNAEPPKGPDTLTPDATSETGAVDGSNPQIEGGPGTDGSILVNDAGDAGNNGVQCPTAAVSFCDDFNRPDAADLKGAWDVVDLNLGGTLALKSSPNRILATAVSAKGGQAQLSKTFLQQPSKIHLELTLTVSSYASEGGVYIGGIAMQSGLGSPSLVYLYVDNVKLLLVQQVTDGANYYNQVLPSTAGVAERISIDLTFNGTLLVKVDNVTKVNEKAQTFLSPKPPSLYLGASSIDGLGDDGSFLIDDVVFTID